MECSHRQGEGFLQLRLFSLIVVLVLLDWLLGADFAMVGVDPVLALRNICIFLFQVLWSPTLLQVLFALFLVRDLTNTPPAALLAIFRVIDWFRFRLVDTLLLFSHLWWTH